MELTDAIENRRSIRHFNNKKLRKELIIEILNAGILAPSAHNRQPWEFAIVTNKELKNKISDTLINTTAETKITGEAIKNGEVLILIYGNIENELLDYQSIGACIENMCLKATSLEISSLWIGYILKIENDIKELINIDKKLIAGLILGYSDTISNARPRKKLEEKSQWFE